MEGTREDRNGKEAGQLAAQTVLQTAGGSAKPQGPSQGVLHTRSRKLMEEYRSIGLGTATGPLVAGSQPSQKTSRGKICEGATSEANHPSRESPGRCFGGTRRIAGHTERWRERRQGRGRLCWLGKCVSPNADKGRRVCPYSGAGGGQCSNYWRPELTEVAEGKTEVLGRVRRCLNPETNLS